MLFVIFSQLSGKARNTQCLLRRERVNPNLDILNVTDFELTMGRATLLTSSGIVTCALYTPSVRPGTRSALTVNSVVEPVVSCKRMSVTEAT